MARSRRSRRTASRRRNSGGGGGGGGGGGCGCCQPCGVCGISLKCAAFIWAIVHIVWGALWVLNEVWFIFDVILDKENKDEPWIGWAWWAACMCLIIFWLVLGIILMLGVRCSTNPCKIHFYLVGVILDLILIICIGIAYAIYYKKRRFGSNLGITIFICLVWWYPYWCIYAYYYQLTGHSWCNCGCH